MAYNTTATLIKRLTVKDIPVMKCGFIANVIVKTDRRVVISTLRQQLLK